MATAITIAGLALNSMVMTEDGIAAGTIITAIV
jgi:hypothetical protein